MGTLRESTKSRGKSNFMTDRVRLKGTFRQWEYDKVRCFENGLLSFWSVPREMDRELDKQPCFLNVRRRHRFLKVEPCRGSHPCPLSSRAVGTVAPPETWLGGAG